MRYPGAVLAVVLLALPLATKAQPIEGLYIGAGVGLDLPQDTRVTPLYPSTSGHQKLVQNVGIAALGSVGYALGNGMRFELEGNFDRNGVRQLARTGFPATTNGTLRQYGLMANALFDLDIGLPWLYPYLGAGAGYQWTKFKSLNVAQVGGPFRFSTQDTEGAFAWQIISGLSFPLPNRPGLSITTEYRFMQILGGEKFSGTLVNTSGGPPTPGRIKLGDQIEHTFLLGVRYAFNVPPPEVPSAAPAPAATPAVQPTVHLVFFDWDKASLTDRARQIVKEAADNSSRVQYTRIEVNGYTDTSGSPRYNQALSIRRARVVAAELVKDGVPRNVISIQGFGQTHLLVPTGPGVREAQNRRVEIIIR